VLLAGICLLSFWLYIDYCGCWSVACVSISVLPAYCMRCYLQHVGVLLKLKATKPSQCVGIYRQQQITNCQYNRSQQDKLVISYLFFLVNAIVISVFTLVPLGVKISLPELAFYATATQDAVVGLVLYKPILQWFSQSQSKLKENQDKIFLEGKIGRERKSLQRIVWSLSLLKCYLGYNNFVVNGTPMVFLDLCTSKIKDLLLLR